MKPLSVLVVAAGIAVSHVAAAPMGVIIVSGPVPTFDKDADALRPYRLTNEFRRPPPAEEISYLEKPVDVDYWRLHSPGPRIQVHPATAGENGVKHKACGRKGKYTVTIDRDAAMARRMRAMMNKLRAALGLPLVEYHHRPNLAVDGADRIPGSALRHHHHQQGEHIVFGAPAQKKEPFDVRLGRALNALGTWEARAITFVLGVGLGALLRMLIVFIILALRARRIGPNGERRLSRCARRRAARREAEAALAAGSLANDVEAPPAYDADGKFLNEKATLESFTAAIEASGAAQAATAAATTAPATTINADAGDLMENVDSIYTIEPVDGELIIHWKHVNGEDKESPAIDFHKKNPQKLLAFYESNLKWRPEDSEEETADEESK